MKTRVDSLHARHLGVCRCDCALVDVGLNNGDSLQQWPSTALARLQGRGVARGLLRCLDATAKSRTVCWYGLEANPAFDSSLNMLQGSLRAQGVRVKLFSSTALSIDGGGANLFACSQRQTIRTSPARRWRETKDCAS